MNKIKIYDIVTKETNPSSSLFRFIQKDIKKNIKENKNFSFNNKKYKISL